MDPEAITLQADKATTTNPAEKVGTLVSKGTSVGRYVVLREVGRGSMGAVFVAIDPKLDRRVALKLLLDDTHCPSATARMIREAQSLASLNHPNVVTVYDAGEHNEHVFIAMEFVEGKTLLQWQGRGRRPWRDVLAAYQQAAMGLAAAHAHGVTHRDFKPDNAMIDAEGRVRVMDFGLARRGEAERNSNATTSGEHHPSALTQTGSIMGTPAYMSPEQFRNGEVGPASDQFSLCVALYEALVGERPFQAATLAELTAAVTRGEVHDVPRGVRAPGWLLQVVRKGLSVAPDDRHASMDALLAAFGRGLGTRRRWGLLAGVTALGALSATGALRPGIADQCREAAEELRGRWTTDRIHALRAAFENTGHANAGDSWKRVERRVDGFIDDWVQESDHLCGAWRDTLTPALLGVRQRCLAVQQGHLDALLQAFTDPTAETVAFASAAAAGLPGPAECTQLDDADHAPPPHSAHTVLTAQRLAARALVRRHVGDSAGALKTYEAALDALGEVKALRARTGILVGLANVLFFAGMVDRAERTLGEAQALAAKSGDLRLTAELWLERLVQLNIHRREQLGRQEHLLEAMDLAVTQAGSRRENVARAAVVRGMIAMDRGDYDAALAHLRTGIDTASHSETTVSRQASYEGLVARVAMLRGDYPTAREASQRAYTMVVEAYGPSHPSAQVHLSNLGAACINQGDVACGRETFEKVRAWLDAAGNNSSSTRANYLVNMGVVERRAGNHARARKLLEAALAMWQSLGTPDSESATLARFTLVYDAIDEGRTDDALELALALDRYFRNERAPGHPESIKGQVVLSAVYRAQKQYTRALTAIDEVLAVRDVDGTPDVETLAVTLLNKSGILEDFGRFEDALPLAERARARLQERRGRPHRLADATFAVARLQWVTGNQADALANGRSAYRMASAADGNEIQRAKIVTWFEARGASPALAADE